MTQSVPFDAYLGASKTGQDIGCIVYQLDGSTIYSAFSTAGWYEAPVPSGDFHHHGVAVPDEGGDIAVGVSGTEYRRVSVGPSAQQDIASIQADTNDLKTSVAQLVASVEAILADTGTDGVAIATATINAIADAILGRSAANVQDTASIYTIAGLILAQFESSAPGTTWNIYKTDGTTVFATRTLTEDENAKPVVRVT